MPCYRCGTRQVDPDRGESPWRRGVREERQVLICPGCQQSHDWTADLDRCPACASTSLVRRLGETECRDCGTLCTAVVGDTVVGDTAPERPSPAGEGTDPGPDLAREVEEALARVLGRAVPR